VQYSIVITILSSTECWSADVQDVATTPMFSMAGYLKPRRDESC